MIDGLYDMVVSIPFSKIDGTVRLTATSDTTLTALVEGKGMSRTIEGVHDGESFSFEGEMPTPFGDVAYTLTGSVIDDGIRAQCVTKLGTFKAKGTRRTLA